MTTFKDLLDKDTLANLKNQTKSTPKPEENSQKPTDVSLPSKNQVQAQVKQLGQQYVDDDKVLFMQAMAGVKPLKNAAPPPPKPKPNPKDPNALFRRAAATGTDDESTAALSDMQALLNPVASEAFLSYKNPTLPTKVFEQLKQGKLRWYEAVDLHGSSIDEARDAITTLLNIAENAGETVVKIVHGKGQNALLKTCVNGWLRQIPSVLAFVSAPAKDGGTGAVLVLLKRQKDKASADFP